MPLAQDAIREIATRYTAAWCSQNPDAVAAYFSPNGTLSVNGAPPAAGPIAIAQVAQAFMTAFPDMRVLMDRLIFKGALTEYHWTLTGTNTGPGGTGHRVRISGYEEWRLSPEGLIEESRGHFDGALYERQLAHGAE